MHLYYVVIKHALHRINNTFLKTDITPLPVDSSLGQDILANARVPVGWTDPIWQSLRRIAFRDPFSEGREMFPNNI